MFSKTFLLKSYTDIEIDKAHTDTKVVLNYIQNELSRLNSMNLDYAISTVIATAIYTYKARRYPYHIVIFKRQFIKRLYSNI